MDRRTVATGLAALRVGIGAGLLLTPRLAQRVWLGPGRIAPRLTRALGARDLALGAAALQALARGAPATAWVRAGAAVDALDGAGHLAAGPRLSPGRRALWSAGPIGMAAVGWWAGARVG